MRNRSSLVRTGFSGVTIGGSAGGQPVPLVILTIVVLAMALLTVWDAATGGSSKINLNKKIPFKCTKCSAVVYYTIKDLQKMQKPGQMGPMMGPLKLDCPKCGGKKTLTQAVQCPKCGEVFIMEMDPKTGMFDDKCPKCGSSYAEAWREKYRKGRKK